MAVLLSLLVSGLGQMYAGRARRGAVIWLLSVGLGLLGFCAIVVLPSWPALALFVVLVAGIPLTVAIDAWRVARAAEGSYSLRPYNRWYVYAVGVLLSASFQTATKRTLNRTVADAFRLPSASMAPTYEAGDYLLVSPLRRAPHWGDVIVYRTEMGPFLKRVVGTSLDTIAMRDGRLIVNGRVVAEPYESHDPSDPVVDDFDWQRAYLAPGMDRATYRASLHTWGPLVIPRDHYFVLGDSRSNSLDSRYMGFVPRDSVTARPFVIYFSWDSAAHSVRWRRLGLAR